MGKMNIRGRNSNTSLKANYQDNYTNDADLGLSNGSRNGRKGKNQVHEKGNTDNGNSGENMLNAGTVRSTTEIMREKIQAGENSEMETSKKSKAIESHNTTSPVFSRP